ncbi:MAG: tetratricopeptide repeat protein [Planctomyces sp.]|nr:tetratricopeptide repeat protein [Planctomyces sp.]
MSTAPENNDSANPDRMYDAAHKLKASGDLAGAVDALKKILEIAPEHVQTHMALAVYQQKLGQLDDAIFHAKRVAELNPTDAFSFTQLSVIYQRCGKILEAEDAMARAREIQGHRH